MNQSELIQLVDMVRSLQCELDTVEVKLARDRLPRKLFETVSAFANSDAGGVILFGIDEGRAFDIVGVNDVQRLQADVSSLVHNQMEPPLSPSFTVADIGGRSVAAVEIHSLSPMQRPCYFKDASLPKGAFIRVGNTNRQMSDYEVFGYRSNRVQPREDEQAVAGAETDDLDVAAVEAYLEQLRKERPDKRYAKQPRDKALRTLRIIRDDEGVLRPTLAGLLMFGHSPEILEPQLMISFVQYAGVDAHGEGPGGERFLDNKQFTGPLPSMVNEAESYIMSRLRTRTLIEGLLRRDIPEYPRTAIREALVNAVAHRDYSQNARASQIQVRLFGDRLEIASPGGLYGNVTVDRLETSQSARNLHLVRMLQDVRLVENRGSGIDSMIDAMRSAGLEPPQFQDDRHQFTVVFRNHTLALDDDAVAWLNAVAGALPINERQKLALLFLRRHPRLTNGQYRRLHPGLDSREATHELQGLVRCGAAVMRGVRGGASYELALPRETPAREEAMSDQDRVVEYIRRQGSIQASTASSLLGWADARRAGRFLASLVAAGVLERQGKKRGTRYVLK